MAEHGALATLKDLAEKEVEDAARLLGEMRRGCQQAEEQLKMLIDYQNEYGNCWLTRRWKTRVMKIRTGAITWCARCSIHSWSWSPTLPISRYACRRF